MFNGVLRERCFMMKAKTLGVLGGMGPFATSVFFERIIDRTEASKDQDHLDMIILNHASLPDRTKSIFNQQKQPFLQMIEKDMIILEQAEVDNIVIPCNTTHYVYDEIQALTDIPVIHMVQSTVQHVHNRIKGNKKVAILATDGTVQSKVYQKEIMKTDMQLHELDDTMQKNVMDIIYHVKGNNSFKTKELDTIIDELVHNHSCDVIILACTELSTVALEEKNKKHCVDALDILVQESIIQSDKRLKNKE